MQNKIYLDNASTTQLNEEVLSSYQKMIATYFENSDALYDSGVKVKSFQENSRKAIADFFNVPKESIIFTSGASEANNIAIKGSVFFDNDRKHIITSSIEHSSVLNAMYQLRDYFGFDLTILEVDIQGKINLETLKNSLNKNTCLVSLMYVNNEVGSINPIKEAAKIIKKNSNAIFHVDMVQALGKINIDLHDIDLASFSAHKIEGLKGSGLLIKKPHIKLLPLINGGQQEFGLRGGTSNALVNSLLYKTIRLCYENQDNNYINKLNNYFINQLLTIDGILINSPEDGVKNIINFSYEKIYSEVMMNALNNKGIMVSAQSTCASNSNNPSRVLLSMGYSNIRSNTCIRVSLSRHNTKDEIDYFITTLKEIVSKYGNI